MRVTLVVVVTLVLGFGVSFGQADSALTFFPLQIGNLWQYHYYYHTTCGNEHSSYHIVEVVGDTILPTGNLYMIVSSDLPPDTPVRYLRVDTTSANVYEYTGNDDCLVDSLLATKGSWFFPNCSWNTECTDVDTEAVLGLPTISKRFAMQFIFGADYTLAQGLGRIQYTTYEDGQCLPALDRYYREIVYARIDGEEYGTLVNVDEGGFLTPELFNLHQNYPNPFNPSTTIRLSIPRSAEVSLKIFNLLGEEVETLFSGHRDAGTHTVHWDATGQPSGVYFYRLQTGGYVETKKLVLLR